ncbi:hypothetical protein [Ktedonospora formicarum]|uniref:hypothetical protein n=1 Tax=Ktedonospora formicarum TaxID=2778364 RepID=UPI001C692AAB|nr:hypothetical protein [Ktedonospora formicarum]
MQLRLFDPKPIDLAVGTDEGQDAPPHTYPGSAGWSACGRFDRIVSSGAAHHSPKPPQGALALSDMGKNATYWSEPEMPAQRLRAL